ncbi:MAG: PAS domain S-box protein [Burkholderiales bacterium]|nr:PAS domain S-box protein [Burkholderiales bacterium]
MKPHDPDLGLERLQPSGNAPTFAPGADGLHDRLLADLPVPLCRVNARGQILHANWPAAQLLGHNPDDLIGLNLHDFGADEAVRTLLSQAISAAGVSPSPQEVRRQRLRTPQRIRHVDLHYSEVRSGTGLHPQWLVALIDQTHLQQEHEALRHTMMALRQAHDTNQELALVADRSPNMIMICDDERRIRWVNPSFTRITGYSLGEAIGQRQTRLLQSPDIDPALIDSVNNRLNRGEAIERLAIQLARKDGSLYWAELTVQPVKNDDGRVMRYITIAQDITDQLQAQSEREALVRAETSHAIKSEFLSRMSHNMRTPLNAVLGFSQLLSLCNDPGLNEGHKQKLDIIHKAGKQLLSLVDQALQLAQLEHRAEPCESRRVDLLPTLTDAVDMLKERASAQHLQIVLEAVPCAAWAEPQRVREVVLNLLSNAIKYSQPHRQIWLRCGPDPDNPGQVFIEVQDQGVGISGDALPLLFQPFTRLESTRAMANGHGLGLAISRRQAQLMQGDITVNSQVGQGSVFRLILPADLNPAEAAAAPLHDDVGTDPYTTVLPAMQVVYVEDNAMNRTLVESVLSAYPQIDVALAGTFAEGVQVIEDTRPDVVLLDINLPDGSGLDICRTIRADAARAQPLLVALSADALPQHIASAMEAGFDEYLVKPLQIHRLLEVLSTARQTRLTMSSQY